MVNQEVKTISKRMIEKRERMRQRRRDSTENSADSASGSDGDATSTCGEQCNDIILVIRGIELRRSGWTSAKVFRKVSDVGVDHIDGPALDLNDICDGDEIVFQHAPNTKEMADIVRKCKGKRVTMYFPVGHKANMSQVFGYQDGPSLLRLIDYRRCQPKVELDVCINGETRNYACNLCASMFNISETIVVHDCDLDVNLKMANALDFLGYKVATSTISVETMSVETDLDNVSSHNDKVKRLLVADRDGQLTEWTKHEYHHGIVNNWNVSDASSRIRRAVSKLVGAAPEPHNAEIENGDLAITSPDVVGVAEIRFGLVNKGNAGIADGVMSTNFHNTNGKDIHVMQKGHTVRLKVVYQDAKEDVVIFKKMRDYKKPDHGKVYLALGYHRSNVPKIYPMLCAYSSGDSERALFLPCNLVDNEWEVVEGYSWYGLSGAPIFDLTGEQVGIFGRGFVMNNIQDNKPGVVMSASTLPAKQGVQEKVFSEAAKTITNEDVPDGMRGYLVVAATGAGKTMRLTRNLMCLNSNASVACLIPTRDSCRAAFESFCKLHNDEMMKNNWQICLEMGEKDGEESIKRLGHGSTKLIFMTYGRFANLTYTRKNAFKHVLLDEFHVRNDDIVKVDLMLATMQSTPKLTCMTATDIGFNDWYKPIADVTVTRRFMIVEKNISDVDCQDGIKIGAGDEEKLGLYKGKALPREWFEQRTIVFVPTIKLCDEVAKYIRRQKNAPPVVIFNSQNRVDIFGLPARCIIVATDVIESSVTVPNCMLVVDYQRQNSVVRTLSSNSKTYVYDTIIIPATQSSIQQRMGRTGRTCDGVYVKMADDEPSVQSLYPTAVIVNIAADNVFGNCLVSNPLTIEAVTMVNKYNSISVSRMRDMSATEKQYKTADWNIDRWTNLLCNSNTEYYKDINAGTKYDPYISVHKEHEKRIEFVNNLKIHKTVAQCMVENKKYSGWHVTSIGIADPDRAEKVKPLKHRPKPEFEEAEFSALGMSVTAAASLGVVLAIINKWLEKNSKRNVVRAHTTTREQFQQALEQVEVGKMRSTKFGVSECKALRRAIDEIKKTMGEMVSSKPRQEPETLREPTISAEMKANITEEMRQQAREYGVDPDDANTAAQIDQSVRMLIGAMEAESKSDDESDLEQELEKLVADDDMEKLISEDAEKQRVALLSALRKKSLLLHEANAIVNTVSNDVAEARQKIDFDSIPEIHIAYNQLWYNFKSDDEEAKGALALLATADGMTFQQFEEAWKEVVSEHNPFSQFTLRQLDGVSYDNMKFKCIKPNLKHIATHVPTKEKLLAKAIAIVQRAGEVNTDALLVQLSKVGMDSDVIWKVCGGTRNLMRSLGKQTRYVTVSGNTIKAVARVDKRQFNLLGSIANAATDAMTAATSHVATGARTAIDAVLGVSWQDIWDEIVKLSQQVLEFGKEQWANTNLQSTMSGLGLGMLYDTIAKYLTRPVAFAVSTAISSFFMYKFLFSPWVCYVISTLLGYFLSRLAFNKTNEFRRIMPNCGLELLVSGLIGGGVGHYLVPQFFDPKNMQLIVPATFAVESAAGNLMPFTAATAPTSNTVLLAKTLYSSYIGMLEGDWHTVTTNMMCAYTAARAGSVPTITIALAIATGLVYVRTMMHKSIDADRVEKAIAARNKEVIDYIDSLTDKDYYKMIDYVLPTLCVVTNPLSLVMVVVGFVVESFTALVIRDEDLTTAKAGQLFADCYKRYSGITIIMAGLDVMMTLLKSFMSDDAKAGQVEFKGIVLPDMAKVTELVTKVRDFATDSKWQEEPAVKVAVGKCEQTRLFCSWIVRKFYEGAMGAATQIAEFIQKAAEKIGEAFARGIVKSITPRVVYDWWYKQKKQKLAFELMTKVPWDAIDDTQPKFTTINPDDHGIVLEERSVLVRVNGKESRARLVVLGNGNGHSTVIETNDGVVAIQGTSSLPHDETGAEIDHKIWRKNVKNSKSDESLGIYKPLDIANFSSGIRTLIDNFVACLQCKDSDTRRGTEQEHLINDENVDIVEELYTNTAVIKHCNGVTGVLHPRFEKLGDDDFVSNTTSTKRIVCCHTDKKIEHALRTRGTAIPQKHIQRDPMAWHKARYINRILPEGGEAHVFERNELQNIDELTGAIRDAGTIIIPNACGGGQPQYIAARYGQTNKQVFYGNKVGPKLLVDERQKNSHSHTLVNVDKMTNYTLNAATHNDAYRKVFEREIPKGDVMIWNDEEIASELTVGNFWENNIRTLQEWKKTCLKKGGSLLVKTRLYGTAASKFIPQIASGFTKVAILKTAITPDFDMSVWLLLRRYKENTQSLMTRDKWEHVVATLDNTRYERVIASTQMIRQAVYSNQLTEQLGIRRSWVKVSGYADDETQNVRRCANLPIEAEILGEKFEPRIEERFELIKRRIKRNKPNFAVKKIDRVGWQHQTSLGSYDSRVLVQPERHTVNKTISDGLHAVFGWDTVNSVIGHTQSDPQKIREAMINVFDKPLAKPTADIQNRMMENMPYIKTKAGREAEGTCKLLTWDEAVIMANKKGAAGIFEGYSNLADFISRDGEEQTKALIDVYAAGGIAANKDNMREKREPKKRKDVDTTGRLAYNELHGNEEAIYEGRNLLPRFIQYGDCADRMADIMLFGDMLQKHAENKLYKGTVGGTPPWHLGAVLKTCWNRGRSANFNERFYKNYEAKMGVKWEASNFEADMAALSEDFSKFDTTVSLEDLVIEMKLVKSFYPKSMHKAIENRYRHKIWSIVVDDFGNIFLREGRRGSGDIMTSFGNSFLNSLLSAVVQQKALGITAEEYWKDQGVLHYVKECRLDNNQNFDLKNSKKGMYEVSRITQFCDGDDKIVIGVRDDIEKIAQESPRIWAEAGKNVKSEMTQNFEEINFCSNTYKPVSIGKDVVKRCIGLSYSERWKAEAHDRVMYLPSRPLPEIVGKLGCTLKVQTMTNSLSEEAKDMTRGKLASAILLYPHFLTIRFFCLMMIAKIDGGREGVVRLEHIGQLREQKLAFPSLTKAMMSIYGVDRWDDIHRVDPLYERDGTKALIHNYYLTKGIPIRTNVEYITPKSVVQRLIYRWPELKEITTQCDYCNLLVRKAVDVSGQTERRLAERRMPNFARRLRSGSH